MTEITFKPSSLRQAAMLRIGWRTPAAVIVGSGLVALCAHITVPLGFTPVPLTMQTFAVLLLGLLFSPGVAFASLALYLIEGSVGIPVFSPSGPGGLLQLLGPTGGYLLSYPFAAALASWLYRLSRRGLLAALTAATLASIVILAAGATWLGILSHASFSMVFAQSVAPFLPGDATKVVAAAACAVMLVSFEQPSQNPSL